jgi:hypothetical protein
MKKQLILLYVSCFQIAPIPDETVCQSCNDRRQGRLGAMHPCRRKAIAICSCTNPVHYLTSVSLLKASHNTVDTHVLNSSLVLIRVSRQRPHHSGLPTTRHGVPVAPWLGHDVQDPQGGRSASRFRSPHPMFTCTHTTHTPHAHVKPFARSLCMKRNHVNPAFGCA